MKPETAFATFVDGDLAVRLSFPAQDAALWRSATPKAILAHLGLADLEGQATGPPEHT
jgi:hypothetical protein